MSTEKSGKIPDDDAKREEAKKLEEQKRLDAQKQEAERVKLLHKLIREKGRVRVSQLYEHFGAKTLKDSKQRDEVRGFVRRMVESGQLADLADIDPETGKLATWYYMNLFGFYKPEKLVKIVPRAEINRIGSMVDDKKRDLTRITARLYGERPFDPFVATILEHFRCKGLVACVKGYYTRTQRGQELGMDAQTLLTLAATELENQLVAREERKLPTIKSLGDFTRLQKRDMRGKMVKPMCAPEKLVQQKSAKMLFLCEALFGNQALDAELLRWIVNDSGTAPDVTFVSGLAQGNFAADKKDKRRILMETAGMEKVGHQMHMAGILLNDLERITKHGVHVVLGDDDWDIGKDYATMTQLAEGKIWCFGTKGSLTAEQERRMWIREFYNKLRIQWEIVLPYQYRIGRGLYNANEVEERIGIRKSEYRLIIEILTARRRKLTYPKEYEKVVSLPELLGDVGNRYVTPDARILKIGQGCVVKEVHSSHFSAITQYVDPLKVLEYATRQEGARGETPADFYVDAHQECFYAHYLHGKKWVATLPGMNDALAASTGGVKTYHNNVQSSKARRQNTFRLAPAIPAAVEVERFQDGRVRFRLLNNRVKRVIEANAGRPEEKKTIAIVSDTQNGSGTMEPECLMKWMDYVLHVRKAEVLWEDGDIVHGWNYDAHAQENERDRIISLRSQERFTTLTQIPLIVDAPALEEFVAVAGNHEWDTFGVRHSGVNPISFLYHDLNGYMAGLRKAGVNPRLKRALVPDRIRWMNTHNPRPDAVYWPYFAGEYAGFKLAMMHMWQPGGKKGGGGGGMRTPVDEMRVWLRNMADACGDIDVMIGGHHHSVWMCQEAEKWLIKVGAAASQSGYELVRGLMSTVMFTLIEVSTRTGITVEFVPWQYLLNVHKCQSPYLKGKDDDLRLPKRGTIEFRHVMRSPLVENLLRESHMHYEV